MDRVREMGDGGGGNAETTTGTVTTLKAKSAGNKTPQYSRAETNQADMLVKETGRDREDER